MGQHHAAAVQYSGSKVVGVIDRNVDLARAVARRYRGAMASNDLAATMEQANPTIAHLCTPADTHRFLAERLAVAKIHAFIEKPMAGSAAETREILNVFERNGARACPVHQYAFQRSVERAIAVGPWIGTVRRIAFDIRSAGGGDSASGHDRIAGEIVPHPLSIIQRLLPGIDIGALDWALQRATPGEWLASANSNGVLLSIAISMGGRPTRFVTIVSGTGGTVELDNFHDYGIYLPGAVSRAAKITQPFVYAGKSLAAAARNLAERTLRRESAYPGLRTLTRQFHDAANSSGRIAVPISAAETIAVAVAREALLAQCPE